MLPEGPGEPTASFRWWLRLQLGMAGAGAVSWFCGVYLGEDFLAGLGCGLLIGALALRFGRGAARREG